MSFTPLSHLAEGGVRSPLCSLKTPEDGPSLAGDPIETLISVDVAVIARLIRGMVTHSVRSHGH